MDNEPLTPPYSWSIPTFEFESGVLDFRTQHDNLWDIQQPYSSVWEGPPYVPDMIEASLASDFDRINSGIGSRTSTMSTYQGGGTFNTDEATFVHPACLSGHVPEGSSFPGSTYNCDSNDSHRTVYNEEEDEESPFEPENGGIQCPQDGCGARLKRIPDVKRHLKEQHECGHPSCKVDIYPTKFARDKHELEAHPNDVLGFHCGSCGLKGSPKRFFRVDKLRGHFKSVHHIQENNVFKGFQCQENQCLPASDGGIFFATRAHLEQHKQSKHPDESKRETEMSNRNIVPRSQRVSQLSTRYIKHRLVKEATSPSKRSRVPDPKISLTASPPPLGKFERILAESIKIIDLCSFVEHPSFPHVIEALKSMQVSTVFVRSIRAIKVCGAQSPNDMDRALDMLSPLLPAKNEKDLPASRRGLRSRSRVKGIPSVPTQPAQILPIRSSEDKEAIHTWKTYVAPEISKLIQDLSIGDSCSVTLVRQQGSLEKFEPVIRFHSPSQTPFTREFIRKEVRQICSTNHRPEIPIQFSHGRAVLLVGTQDFPDEPSADELITHQRRYFKRPGMGISIGMTQCEHEFASLGGYILVGNRQVMLTVEHLEQKARDCALCHSTGILDNSLSSPSPSDIRNLKEELEDGLRSLDDHLQHTNALADGIDMATFAKIWAETYPVQLALSKQMKRFQEDLSKPPKHYNFGKVMDHSDESGGVKPCLDRPGAPSDARHRMDWAIYDIDRERLGKNKFVHPVGIAPSHKDIENEITNPYGTGAACTEWREFQSGEIAYYVGVQSRYREGVINGSPAICQIEGRTSQEWHLRPLGSKIDETHVEGDSGAWVLGKDDNKLLGLLWGLSDGNILFTPIADVFNQIEQKHPGEEVQVAGLNPGGAIRPTNTRAICGTKPRRCLFDDIWSIGKPRELVPVQLSIEVPINSEPSTAPSTPELSLSRSPSPTPSLTPSVSSPCLTPFMSSPSESPSPSVQPVKLRPSGPYDLSDPFEKLDLTSRPHLMSVDVLLDENDYSSQDRNGDLLEAAHGLV